MAGAAAISVRPMGGLRFALGLRTSYDTLYR